MEPKNLIVFVVLLLAVPSCQAGPIKPKQASQPTKVYNRSGVYQGKSVQRGNETKFYDKTGRLLGNSKERKGTITYYDRTGKIIGRTKQ